MPLPFILAAAVAASATAAVLKTQKGVRDAQKTRDDSHQKDEEEENQSASEEE